MTHKEVQNSDLSQSWG